jgi:hypothetical protein
MSGPIPSDPRRGKKRNDRSEMPVTFLPQGNPRARTAYLCAIIGLIPGVGLLLGPPAIIFGRLGYIAAKKDPETKGIGHSYISVILGIFEIIASGVGLTLLAYSLDLI